MTTFDRLMQNSKFKAEFEKGYNEFLISEFMMKKWKKKIFQSENWQNKQKCLPPQSKTYVVEMQKQ